MLRPRSSLLAQVIREKVERYIRSRHRWVQQSIIGLAALQTATAMAMCVTNVPAYGLPLETAPPSTALFALPNHVDWTRSEFLRKGAPRAESLPEAQQANAPYCSFGGEGLAAAPFQIPIEDAYISSPFGMRFNPAKGKLRKHTGVDLAAPTGTPVKAAGSGAVELIGFEKRGYGRYVVLQHADGYSTWYAHLSAAAAHLHEGMQIRAGQLIGKVGRTGDATGPHLHFEVRYSSEPVDPLPLIHSHISSMFAAADPAEFHRHAYGTVPELKTFFSSGQTRASMMLTHKSET
jgi:hypothetical protein